MRIATLTIEIPDESDDIHPDIIFDDLFNLPKDITVIGWDIEVAYEGPERVDS